ncbi:YbhB/YbcL family Raf kinase inhibitor-like protein [Acetobacteraceae bacterium KSS8]|uniref:YbhB/YbcL family Raf kinase inhibitor-like protein n=1 Tax=Endosaccharibacter trunci TaxID=2812733 RepID=A0ABT1W6X3_9PROT|nr:YbhB/YbcL family Raf kinase inhibitor-like protein [Acetobacteraceae bacterium KSS8]
MLENIPAAIGHALHGVRNKPEDLVWADPAFADVPDIIQLTSPAFPPGGAIPAAHTEDGEGISPPLEWIGVPPEAEALVLLVEDQDSPTPKPLVHAILPGLQARDGRLEPGALPGKTGPGTVGTVGRNSFWQRAWLPPDPPTGHGPHRYVFQLFALDRAIDATAISGRGALVKALHGHVLALGTLTGTYERS